jgi:hypothetical protein
MKNKNPVHQGICNAMERRQGVESAGLKTDCEGSPLTSDL